MIETTIAKIEKILSEHKKLSVAKRTELQGLLARLKVELHGLSKTHSAAATKMAQHTEKSAHAALSDSPDQPDVDLSLKGLAGTVEEFEYTHPKLTEIINAWCKALSDAGV